MHWLTSFNFVRMRHIQQMWTLVSMWLWCFQTGICMIARTTFIAWRRLSVKIAKQKNGKYIFWIKFCIHSGAKNTLEIIIFGHCKQIFDYSLEIILINQRPPNQFRTIQVIYVTEFNEIGFMSVIQNGMKTHDFWQVTNVLYIYKGRTFEHIVKLFPYFWCDSFLNYLLLYEHFSNFSVICLELEAKSRLLLLHEWCR